MGITEDLGNWLLNFLSDRKHFVRMPGGISNDGPVLSGVPQGTVLGPLLFLVLLSDISKDINYSSVVSFADDTRVFRQIIDINDCSLLQNDLDNIFPGLQSTTWYLMIVNSNICHIIIRSSIDHAITYI